LIPVKLRPEVHADLRELPNQRIQKVALAWLIRLRRDPQLGQPLAWRHGGDLSDCRKLYFEERDEPLRFDFTPRPRSESQPRFRVVYRIVPDERRPEHVQVIAIGLKYPPPDKPGVYEKATGRLDRLIRRR